MNKESKKGIGSKRTNKYLIALLLLAALLSSFCSAVPDPGIPVV